MGTDLHSLLIEDLRAEIARLKDAVAQARSSEAGYLNLLTVAAHEIRTPLHAIGLHLEMVQRLSRRGDAEGVNVQIAIAQRVLKSFARRSSLLIDVTRVQSGQLTLRREPVLLSDIVTQIVDLYSAKAEFQQTRIEAHVEPDLCGNFDRAAVETIMANLVSNALKYGEGAPVTVEAQHDSDGNAVIRVIDTGPGITRDRQQHIFEKFGRTVQPRHATAGFGLGLWIVRHLATLHGGTVVLQQTSGRGCTFVVTMPMGQSKATAMGV
ncbi:MAG: HAMP domain-containing histidine kinase [Pseudomonadota bacterium]|nr:HAMP domain-containing histidine kinase [Pseudomonadota bacterium]